MKIIEKDILTVESGVLVHQTNTKGVMGSGVAKALKDKWPIIFHNYSKLCKNYNSDYLLGKIDPVLVDSRKRELWVVNLFGQANYGYDGKRYTEYYAWDLALKELNQLINTRKVLPKEIYFPYNCGACRGGGDFRIISLLIEAYFPDAFLCKISEKNQYSMSQTRLNSIGWEIKEA